MIARPPSSAAPARARAGLVARAAALALGLAAAGCAGASPGGAFGGAEGDGASLAPRLPPELGGFRLVRTAPVPDGAPGALAARYEHGPTGAWATVFLLASGLPPGALPDGPDSPRVAEEVETSAQAVAVAAGAGAKLAPAFARGPDFSAGARDGTGPAVRCADLALADGGMLRREMVCATGVSGRLVKIRLTQRHAPLAADVDLARRFLGGFAAAVARSLSDGGGGAVAGGGVPYAPPPGVAGGAPSKGGVAGGRGRAEPPVERPAPPPGLVPRGPVLRL